MASFEILEGHRKDSIAYRMGLIVLGKTRISMALDI